MSYTMIVILSILIGFLTILGVMKLNIKSVGKPGFIEPLLYGISFGFGSYIVLGAYFFNNVL